MQRISFDAQITSPAMAVKEAPKWVSADMIPQLDRRASATIAQSLPSDQPARVKLLELTLRPQKEVRWLALRCLGYVGQFHEMVSALNDPLHRLDWPDYVEQLCEAVARDSASAAAVRQALEKQYPDQAAPMYRMLWGYTDDDLQGGSDKDLVNGLDDDLLAVRVLSICNLTKVTGLGKIYQPEQPAAKRKQATERWRQRLKANEIRVKTPEEKVGATARENAAEMAPTEPAP